MYISNFRLQIKIINKKLKYLYEELLSVIKRVQHLRERVKSWVSITIIWRNEVNIFRRERDEGYMAILTSRYGYLLDGHTYCNRFIRHK